MRTSRFRLVPAALLAASALVRPCSAETKPRYGLSYSASEGCPERAAFVALVEGQLAPSPQASVEVPQAQVTLAASGAVTIGRIELESGAGHSSARELSGGSCEEVARGLAFILAYALGAAARDAAAVTETKTAASPAPTPGTPTAAAPLRRRAPTQDRARPPVANGARWRWGLAAMLGARGGLAPTWTTVEGVALGLRAERRGLWAPSVRIGVWRAAPVLRIDRFGTTEFGWASGRAEVCPLEVPLVGTLAFSPCLSVHAGRISASGTPRTAPGAVSRRASNAWVDATVGSRLAVRSWDVLAIELSGELSVPFIPYRFAFDGPDTSVYRVPAVGWAGHFALGVHFP